jgi:branched-chain amino acid transport system ATP-binding protein
MDVVFAYADRILVLAGGALIAEGQRRRDPRKSKGAAGLSRHRIAPRGARRGASVTEPMLAVEGLRAWYGAAQILFNLSFRVASGEVVALMGRNVAGKTTTLRALMGLMPQRSGTVRFVGEDISRLKPFEIARRGVGYVPEDRRIFSDLTVLENLDIGRQRPRLRGDARAVAAWTPERLFKIFPNLATMPHRWGANMSGGEQQMLTVARTLMGNPLLVLLDEPSEGVAPVIVEEMADTIIELKKEGLSVLLSEQNIHFAEIVRDRVYVLEKGQIRWTGPIADLAGDIDVQRRLLSV